MTKDKFSPTRRSVLRLGAMSALGIGVGIPAVSGSVAATSCPRTPGYWANHPKAWGVEYPYDLYGYVFVPKMKKNGPEPTNGNGDYIELLDPSEGAKDLIMAKHLMATILNFQNRKKEDDPCLDKPIKYGPYEGSTVREVKRKAEDWLENAEKGQEHWYVNGVNGEPIKNVLDTWNNNPQKLGLKYCPCYGDD
ncbi:Tat pathway signal protein [Haloferax sp. DFSO52]|uniref:Tat pathway signal protein n=1 Tax=Haloferax sp. DFSO52 TaxID=3388505 RepID=UPI003A8A9FEE